MEHNPLENKLNVVQISLFLMVCLVIFSTTIILARYESEIIPCTAFQPESPVLRYRYNTEGTFLEANSSNGYFLAPVSLPQNAKVIKVILSCYDTSPEYDIGFMLSRKNLKTRKYEDLFGMRTSGATGNTSVIDRSLNHGSPVINNDSFSYFIRIYFTGVAGDKLRFFWIKVIYT